MDEILRLIIAQQQNRTESYPIVRRDLRIQPVHRKATVIIGIRRCGKSTWQREKINQLLAQGVPKEAICWIDFSDDRLFFLRSEDANPAVIADIYYAMYPEAHKRTTYFFFDEIPYVNHWAQFVNRLQTTERCEVYLTGSSAKLLSKEIATELGGSAFPWELFPFSFREFLRATGKPEKATDITSRDEIIHAFDRYVLMGGMPERLVLPDDAMAVRYFQNLVEDVMTRDVLLRYDVPHPVALQRLVQMLMGSMSCPMTVNKLKQRLAGERYSLSPLVITEYLGMLGDCYMVFLVPIRSANMAVRSVNPKKVYVGDHALAAAFAQSVSPNQGLALENMVFLALRRQSEDIFYYRTAKGEEIDFAVGPDTRIRLLQVCWNLGTEGKTRDREIAALWHGMEELGVTESWIITSGESEEITEAGTGRRIHIVPAWRWLLEASQN